MDGTVIDRDTIIKAYFLLGFSNKEIRILLAYEYGIVVSERTMKRITSKNGLYRRKHYSDVLDIAVYICELCKSSSCQHGYRWMYRELRKAGFNTNQETVRILLGVVDPDGVNSRKRRRLRRRQYRSKGPNSVWHIDGYDKLKPYGICIHGCIDGFSRNVLWAEAWSTNNDPTVTAGYFIETVKRLDGCPERIRSDEGTENRVIEQLQYLLRLEHVDEFAAKNSFLYGSSTLNQRIESWWGILRKQCLDYWIQHFKNLKDDGYFSGDFLDKNLVIFCYLDAIQKEINNMVENWNYHKIRPSKNSECPHGRPIIMYAMPDLYQVEDHLKPIANNALRLCESECTFKGDSACDKTIREICGILMTEFTWEFPPLNSQLCDLYLNLRREIKSELL